MRPSQRVKGRASECAQRSEWAEPRRPFPRRNQWISLRLTGSDPKRGEKEVLTPGIRVTMFRLVRLFRLLAERPCLCSVLVPQKTSLKGV